MKKYFFMILVVISVGCVSAQENNDKNIKILHVSQNGDRSRSIILKPKMENSSKIDNSNESIFSRKKAISSKLFEYTRKYISIHCDTNDKKVINQGQSHDFYVITFFNNDEKAFCYLKSKESSKVFLSGLEEWVKKYPNKQQAIELLKEIEIISR